MNENFLINFLKLAKGTEIPQIFAFWSGVAAISASLGRRVWLDMGPYTIFPNFYIVLVAPSGQFRKSSSVRLASGLLKELVPRPNLISQNLTPSALMEAMNANQTTEGTKLAVTTATGFAIVDELSTFLNRKSYEAGLASMLIEFYDCPADYEYRTRARGIERLEQPCLGILSASTVDWIRDAIPPEAVGGGLTSRCIFVYAETPPPPVARTSYTQEQLTVREVLLSELQTLSAFSGPVTLEEEAWKFYEEEYVRFYHKAGDLWRDKYLTGYAARRHIHWLKLSIVFAAAAGTLTVSLQHLEAALKMLEQVEKHMKMVLSLVTASDMGGHIARVEEFIKKYTKELPDGRKVGPNLAMVARTMMNHLSGRQLKEVIDTLVAAKVISMVIDKQEVYYVYTGS